MGLLREFISLKYRMVPNRRKICLRRENKPIPDGYTKTGPCVGANRKLDAAFFVKCIREFADATASGPTVQLQIIRVLLAVIAYRKWNFRAMDVSMAFLRSVHLKTRHLRETSRRGSRGQYRLEATETTVWDE